MDNVFLSRKMVVIFGWNFMVEGKHRLPKNRRYNVEKQSERTVALDLVLFESRVISGKNIDNTSSLFESKGLRHETHHSLVVVKVTLLSVETHNPDSMECIR